jgi:TonB family protein
MKILKMKNFFIVIIVVSVSLVFSSCKEEKEQTEISSSSVVVQEEKSQKNKTENVTDFDKGGIGSAAWIEILPGPGINYWKNAKKGHVKVPSFSDIDLKFEKDANRSASDVMKVVRQRTPGLRHIYNQRLKSNSGFQGVITLKITIAPSGEILDVSIFSSTTKDYDFDAEIQEKVSCWTFGKIKSGKTTVTMPLIFSK